METLGIVRSIEENYMLLRRNYVILYEIIILKVEDVLEPVRYFYSRRKNGCFGITNKEKRDAVRRKFFSGPQLERGYDCAVKMTRTDKFDKIQTPESDMAFVGERELAKYIILFNRPDICNAIELVSP